MNNQKGMTLIEVMVAMLVLSIAMIGGISFFTSAYRINYSYMESANRIDHALRYVEKLKVQRRDYPTFGAFSNIGGSGFTAYFVDSEFNDYYENDPYFYENYAPGIIHLPATFIIEPVPGRIKPNIKIPANGSFQPRGFYYRDEAYKVLYSTIPYTSPVVTEDYGPDFAAYPKSRISYALQDAYDNGLYFKFFSTEEATFYLKYHYDRGTGVENNDAYAETTFAKMAKYSKSKKYQKLYDSKRLMTKYHPYTILDSMFGPGGESHRWSFPSGIKTGTITTPSGKVVPVSTSDPYFLIAPLSCIYVPSVKEAEGFYTQIHLTTPILIKAGSVQENTGESSSIIGSEGFTFDSRRFYKDYPSISTHDEVHPRDSIESIYTTKITRPHDDPNKSDLEKPDPVLLANSNLYHRDAMFVAHVYKGNATGKEQIKKLYKWHYDGGTPPSGVPINVFPANRRVVFQVNVGKINPHRLTRYRRSVYISVWPFESDAAARALIREAIDSNPDFQARVDYIKSKKTSAQKMIMIPFIQLYAHDENSTLCEAL